MSSASKLQKSRAIADLSAGSILASVEIAAPPARVFSALTTEQVTKWWGMDGVYWTTDWQADLRKGGRWRAGGKDADGNAFAVEGEYLEVDPPHLLVQTWKPDFDPGLDTKLTYRLEAIEGGTRLTLRHEGFGTRSDSAQSHGIGWEMVLGWLANHLAPAPAPARFFMCRLKGPRPTFPADMNEAEGRAMHEHVAYWHTLMAEGKAHVFGPVAEPTGVWGLAVLEVADEAEAKAILAQDPTVRAQLGFSFEPFPMLNAVVRR